MAGQVDGGGTLRLVWTRNWEEEGGKNHYNSGDRSNLELQKVNHLKGR